MDASGTNHVEMLKELQKHINSLRSSVKGNNPKDSHVRDYLETLTDSLNSTIKDVAKDKLMWSNLMVDKKMLIASRVAPDVNISAYKIVYPEECSKFKGYWCFSEMDGRFYISINDKIYGGKCLDIKDEDTPIYKFNEHKNARNINYKDTGLYVPPEVNPTSKDIRTLTSSMHYSPSKSDDSTNEQFAFKIGSAENLREDLVNMTNADHRLFKDITISFLLALTAAGKVPTN